MNLAEVRMHLRDEYTRKTDPWEHLRRKQHLASTVASTEHAATPAADPGPSSIAAASPALPVLPFSDGVTIPDSESTIPMPSNPGPAPPDETEDDNDEDSLISIARNLQERSQLDDDTAGGPAGNHDFTRRVEKIKLAELFDFSNTMWIDITQRTCMKSLDKELELYELVDMDAEGEADDGDVVDDPMLSR